MTTVRVLLAQLPNRVGDLPGNTDRLVAAARAGQAGAADVVLAPEMAVTGYPPEDLLAEPSFVTAAQDATSQVACRVADAVTIVGGPWRASDLPAAGGARERSWSLDAIDRPLRNVAAIAHRGHVVAAHAKTLLPTYSVFDDARHIAPGAPSQALYRVQTPAGPVTFAVLVCEDVWDPALVAAAAAAGAQLVVCPNASPYHVGKPAARLAQVSAAARAAGVAVAYVNGVGGQDELVFDGGSFVVDAHGDLVARAAWFAPDEVLVDVPVPPARPLLGDVVDLGPTHTARPPIPRPACSGDLEVHQEVYTALVSGFGDYCRRVGIPRVVLGLSGGIDSALAAVIAVDALGPEAVWGVGMPGPYSSQGSVDHARQLAANLGIRFDLLPIDVGYNDRRGVLESLLITGGAAGGRPVNPVAWENLQARLRGVNLMTLANATGALVCTTGNRSESAVGYFTLYGDSCGTAPNPLGDLLKTSVTMADGTLLPGVYDLAAWRNERAISAGQVPPIPVATLTKPASAELAPGQQDTDSLPAYPVLDKLLVAFLEEHATADDLVEVLAADGWVRDDAVVTVNRVLRLVDSSEFKRRQAPLRIKVSRLAFGRDRRMPLASHWSHASATSAATPVTA